MPLTLADIYILCPVCKTRTLDQVDQDSADCRLIEVHFSCRNCDTTCTAFYDCYRVSEIMYGQPIGPVYLTEFPWQALAAWEVDEAQWIRTDGTQFAVGYEPIVFQDGRGSMDGWEETSPEELEARLADEEEAHMQWQERRG
jgi:hypothetical protein